MKLFFVEAAFKVMQIAFRRFKNIKIPGGQTPLGASRIRRPQN
jgi:hypothetical protein